MRNPAYRDRLLNQRAEEQGRIEGKLLEKREGHEKRLLLEKEHHERSLMAQKEQSEKRALEQEKTLLKKAIVEGLKATNTLPGNPNSLLHRAVQQGSSELAQALMQSGTDHVDASGMTALHHATELNRLELVKLLVEAGASSSIEDAFYRTANDNDIAVTARFGEVAWFKTCWNT